MLPWRNGQKTHSNLNKGLTFIARLMLVIQVRRNQSYTVRIRGGSIQFMNTQHTDIQLKQALAKMLPETVREDYGTEGDDFHLEWKVNRIGMRVLDTELLHLCWLVEETISSVDEVFKKREYIFELMNQCGVSPDMGGKWSFIQDFALTHATWQQRTIALAKVKGVEIV